jgi:hypothetical protein
VNELPPLRETLGRLDADVARAVARYLDSGVIICCFEEEGIDLLDVDIEIAPPELMTDGFWVWRSETAYYVSTYRASLDPDFVEWALQKRTADPRNVDPDDVDRWLKKNGW